jgi:hypothetical protein
MLFRVARELAEVSALHALFAAVQRNEERQLVSLQACRSEMPRSWSSHCAVARRAEPGSHRG